MGETPSSIVVERLVQKSDRTFADPQIDSEYEDEITYDSETGDELEDTMDDSESGDESAYYDSDSELVDAGYKYNRWVR